jgi:hypothetical protein
VRAAGALVLVGLLACSRGRQDQHAAAPRPAQPDSGSTAKPELTAFGADISWLVGTWERQSAPKEWLLFNAPKEVGVISGNPPVLNGRGEFIPNGKYISLFFRGTGGATIERLFEASADFTELTESSNPPATYRRGAPP